MQRRSFKNAPATPTRKKPRIEQGKGDGGEVKVEPKAEAQGKFCLVLDRREGNKCLY